MKYSLTELLTSLYYNFLFFASQGKETAYIFVESYLSIEMDINQIHEMIFYFFFKALEK